MKNLLLLTLILGGCLPKYEVQPVSIIGEYQTTGEWSSGQPIDSIDFRLKSIKFDNTYMTGNNDNSTRVRYEYLSPTGYIPDDYIVPESHFFGIDTLEVDRLTHSELRLSGRANSKYRWNFDRIFD